MPGTIADLAKAGIKTWVLTGDKVETAINIGRTCRLLTDDLGQPMVVDGESRQDVVDQLERFNGLLDAMEFGDSSDYDEALEVAYPGEGNGTDRDGEDEEQPAPTRSHARSNGSQRGSGNPSSRQSGGSNGSQRGGRQEPRTVVSSVHTTGGSGRGFKEQSRGPGNKDGLTFASSPRGSGAVSPKKRSSRFPLHPPRSSSPASEPSAAVSRGTESGAADRGYNPDEDVEDLDTYYRCLYRCGCYMPGRVRKFYKPVRLPRALVVTGPSLDLLLHGKDTKEEERLLLSVGLRCQAVIACRVSPKQKADIVGIVRNCTHPKPMTLAIGDGANDVAMIQNAQIGVGISGKEGLQAANAADFSIAQFRFLRRLLLVHGRWSYRRMSKVLLYSFYKNIVITITLFLYSTWAGYSGTSLYESLVYSIFNFVLGLPIIACGVLDQDVREETVLAHPALYMSGLNNMDLTVLTMTKWILQAFVHGIVVFYIPFGAFYATGTPLWSQDGKTDGIDVAGFAVYSSLIWAMQLKVALITDSWTWVHWTFLGISQAGFYLFVLLYALLLSISPQWYYVGIEAVQRPAYWLAWILGMAVVGVFDVVLVYVSRQWDPTTPQVAAELDNEEQGDGWCDAEGAGEGTCDWGNEPGGENGGAPSGTSGSGGLKGGSPHSSHHHGRSHSSHRREDGTDRRVRIDSMTRDEPGSLPDGVTSGLGGRSRSYGSFDDESDPEARRDHGQARHSGNTGRTSPAGASQVMAWGAGTAASDRSMRSHHSSSESAPPTTVQLLASASASPVPVPPFPQMRGAPFDGIPIGPLSVVSEEQSIGAAGGEASIVSSVAPGSLASRDLPSSLGSKISGSGSIRIRSGGGVMSGGTDARGRDLLSGGGGGRGRGRVGENEDEGMSSLEMSPTLGAAASASASALSRHQRGVTPPESPVRTQSSGPLRTEEAYDLGSGSASESEAELQSVSRRAGTRARARVGGVETGRDRRGDTERERVGDLALPPSRMLAGGAKAASIAVGTGAGSRSGRGVTSADAGMLPGTIRSHSVASSGARDSIG